MTDRSTFDFDTPLAQVEQLCAYVQRLPAEADPNDIAMLSKNIHAVCFHIFSEYARLYSLCNGSVAETVRKPIVETFRSIYDLLFTEGQRRVPSMHREWFAEWMPRWRGSIRLWLDAMESNGDPTKFSILHMSDYFDAENDTKSAL